MLRLVKYYPVLLISRPAVEPQRVRWASNTVVGHRHKLTSPSLLHKASGTGYLLKYLEVPEARNGVHVKF